MKLEVNSYNAVAYWKWNTNKDEPHKLYRYASGEAGDDDDDDDEDDDVCGICQAAFESTCPACSVPGDDCPLIWGRCTHVFHMHCLLKWLETESSKQQCPMDRRPWETEDREPDQLPTTTDRAPVATVQPGLVPEGGRLQIEPRADVSGEADVGDSDSMEVDEGEEEAV
ncbi:hypothetical protein IAT38_004725 [Cryptococcus sp. DSM 104549]